MAELEGIPCPICGEPLDRGAEGCANCGAAVSETALRELTRALGIDSAKAQALFRAGVHSADDLGGRSVGDVLNEKAPAVLYLCPECGAFVSSADRNCGKCGATLAEETVDLERFLEEGTRACPACGETIPAEALVCPACQATIVTEGGGPETTVLCGNCGAMVLEGLAACDTCGAPMGGIPQGPVAPSEKGPVCPSCGAVLTEDDTVCEMCGREVGAPVEPTPSTMDSEMRAIDQLLEESEPEKEAETAAAGLDALAIEVEAEEAVLDLEAAPKTRVKVAAELRVATAPPPRERTGSPVERLRDTAVVATLAALLPAGIVSTLDSYVGGFAIVALAGSLLATALALAFLDFRPIRQRWRDHAIALAGGLLILAVPVHNGVQAVLPEAADGALLILGTALGVAGGAPIRHAPAVYAPWLAALPAFVAAAAAMAVDAPPASPAITIGTWAAIAVLVGTSAVLSLRRRWVDGRVSRSVMKAQELAVDKNYKGAIEELDRAIDLAGEAGSEAPWYSKGAALVVLGRYEEALACIDTALRMNPKNEVAWVNKGNALARMGRLVDALKCYNSAIKVNPGYEVGWNNKGNALARLGKYPDALRCYERALQIDAGYKGAWVNKGYVLTKLGDFEAAAKCADEVVRLGGTGGVAA